MEYVSPLTYIIDFEKDEVIKEYDLLLDARKDDFIRIDNSLYKVIDLNYLCKDGFVIKGLIVRFIKKMNKN